MIDSKPFESLGASQSYTDINSVNTLRNIKDKKAALSEICKQFESMMVRQMLDSMRKANEVFAKDNPFSSNDTKFYQNMMDDQLALSMSTGRGMGIAEVMERQLSQSLGMPAEQAGEKPQHYEVKDIPVRHHAQAAAAVASPATAATEPGQSAWCEFDGTPETFVR